MSIGEFRNQTGFFVEALRRVARDRPHVSVLDVGKHFCDEKTCSMTRGAELLYREKSHLNLVGSLYLANRLLEDNRGLFD